MIEHQNRELQKEKKKNKKIYRMKMAKKRIIHKP